MQLDSRVDTQELEHRVVDGVTFITVRRTRLDAAVVPYVIPAFDALRGTSARVVLDLSQTTFVDSSGVGMIVHIMRRVGGRLAIAGASEAVATVFRLTRLD